MLRTAHVIGSEPSQVWLDRFQREFRTSRIIDGPGYRVVPAVGHGSQLILDPPPSVRQLIHRAVIRSIQDDYLECRLGKSTTADTLFKVAKPWALRKSSYDGTTLLWDMLATYEEDGLSRTLSKVVQDAQGASKTIEIIQEMLPAYVAETGDVTDAPPDNSIIYVAEVSEGTDLEIDDTVIEWIDINPDARAFENPIVPYMLCQNDVKFDALFAAGVAK